MTKQKTFKRRVRRRMAKTGESYTAARAQLVAPAVPSTSTSSESVTNATGQGFDHWFALLDRWGATSRTHRDIARWLMDSHEVPGWWAQNITVEYERARGMRAKGQRADGTFSATASKTVDVPLARLYEAFVDDEVRARWLGEDAPVSLRRSSDMKSARFEYGDGSTRVVVGFLSKGDAKSNVGLEHEKLPDAATAEELKAFWRSALVELKRVLES